MKLSGGKALDLIAEGKPVKHITEDLGARQEPADTGEGPSDISVENAEFARERRCILELEE